MKKLIILFMLFTIPILSQELTISSFNSTTTALDSAGVFTGTVEETGFYSYLTIIIKSDRASATNGLRVMFGKTSTVFEHNYFFSYSAADTLTNKITLPITGGYFKIVYTNTTTAQTTFSLTTYMHKQAMLPFTSEGKLSVADATVEATLTNIEADADSIVDKVTEIDNNTDMIETKLDSIDASSTRVEGKIDNTNTKLDSIEVTVNNIENKVATEAKQDTMEVSLNAIQSAVGTGNATLDSLEVTANAIQTAVGTTNTKLDSIDASNTRIEGYIDGAEAKLDSIDASSTRVEGLVTNSNTKLDSLDASTTRIEGYTDGLETKADTSNARIQEIKLDIENLKIYNAPTTKYVGLTDTVTTRTDTTTFTGTWVGGEIKADDSCEVAIDGSFPSGQTYIITETTAVKLPKWAIATSDKLFVRRYGGAGTVRFYLRLNSY